MLGPLVGVRLDGWDASGAHCAVFHLSLQDARQLASGLEQWVNGLEEWLKECDGADLAIAGR